MRIVPTGHVIFHPYLGNLLRVICNLLPTEYTQTHSIACPHMSFIILLETHIFITCSSTTGLVRKRIL